MINFKNEIGRLPVDALGWIDGGLTPQPLRSAPPPELGSIRFSTIFNHFGINQQQHFGLQLLRPFGLR